MKLSGYLKGTGKLGNIVCSQVGGETIARDYVASISNPNTNEQVGQRARFKLMSQVAASMASVIVIPKKGLVSSRNQFVKKNFDQSFVSGNEAGLFLENIQLTGGSAGLPGVNVVRDAANNKLTVSLSGNVQNAVSRVVYNAFSVSSEGSLQLVGSVVATAPGEDGNFPAELPNASSDVVVYGYGMKDTNSKASAKYGNYNVNSGEDVAKLIMSRKLAASDYQLTETSGSIIESGATESLDIPDGHVKVTVIGGSGTVVSVTGQAQPKAKIVFAPEVGTSVTATATLAQGYTFSGWMNQATGEIVSTDVAYTWTVADSVVLIATATYTGGGME